MSNQTNNGKSSINVKRLVMWGMKSDTDEGTTYDTEVREFLHQLNSARYVPKVQTAEQYGDGVKVEDYVAKDGGELDIVIRGFTDGDNEFLFGETNKNGTSVSNAGDIVPYVCAAYATERPDGKLNLFKFPKVKFMPQGEDSRQREGSTVNYGTANIKGTYSPLLSNGDDCYTRLAVDPKTDAELITKWFSKADYTGEKTTAQNSGASALSLEKAGGDTETLQPDDEGE